VSKLGRVIGGLAAAGTAVNALFVWKEGRLQQVKLGSLAVWDRERWEQRPLVQRVKARIAARGAAREK
jgi:hypothetical protein